MTGGQTNEMKGPPSFQRRVGRELRMSSGVAPHLMGPLLILFRALPEVGRVVLGGVLLGLR